MAKQNRPARRVRNEVVVKTTNDPKWKFPSRGTNREWDRNNPEDQEWWEEEYSLRILPRLLKDLEPDW